MNKLFAKAASVTLLTIAVCGFAVAQNLPTAESFVGEKLLFEGKVSKIIQGIAVADITFSFDRDGDRFVIKSTANSKGTLARLFRFSFLQDYETTVDPATFNVIATKKHDVQRERIRDSIADFNYAEKRVTFIESDPNNPTRPPRRIASDLTAPMNDLASAAYRVRMMPLKVGDKFDVPISDSGLVYSIPVKVVKRERQKTKIGKIWCYRIDPEIFGPNRLIEGEGSMSIWIADNPQRTPVRAVVKFKYGKFDIRIQDPNDD
ncbi:MAG: hypothetical protein UZ17_ACD001000483 [Acidobacteria bacterium OLB17]|nr:MAG: hypothetical protein UZ17_ACD001000483 [Acidobacteria bacterium OLB17]MCZ2391112.1 DUF3108 domain-containing protein [Acidobacteriota bacterium]